MDRKDSFNCTKIICPKCEGSGKEYAGYDEYTVCKYCEGKRVVKEVIHTVHEVVEGDQR